MQIRRKSPVTGETHVREINVTREQIDRWEKGELAQHVFYNLNNEDREFIISGTTEDDWAEMFGDVME